MPAGLIALHLLLAFGVFLTTLNGYLHGRLKPQIDAALSMVLIGTIAAIWFLHGSTAGLVSLALTFLYGALTNPLAKAAAYRLLGYRTSAESGNEYRDLQALTAGKLSFDRYMEKSNQRSKRERRQLERLIATPKVQAVLGSTGRSADDIIELVKILVLSGTGRELALSAVTNPPLLIDLLAMRAAGEPPLGMAARVMRL